jgi:hypothetical protein
MIDPIMPPFKMDPRRGVDEQMEHPPQTHLRAEIRVPTIGKQARLAEPIRDLPREQTTERGGRGGGRGGAVVVVVVVVVVLVFVFILAVRAAVFTAGASSGGGCCYRSRRSSRRRSSSGGEGGVFALVELPLLLVGSGFDEEQAEESEGDEGVDAGEGLPGAAYPGGVRGHDEEEEEDVLREGREGRKSEIIEKRMRIRTHMQKLRGEGTKKGDKNKGKYIHT